MTTLSRPRLSVVVVAYRMPTQLQRTLHTLSTAYQRNVSQEDYEVIVVENSSDQNLDEHTLEQLPANFRYFLRDESSPTPVHALNFGFEQARGEYLGIMIDGAHMVTPRVIEHALACFRAHPNCLVAIPVHHLGPQEQHISTREGYNSDEQDRLLASVDWRQDGYELFRISVWCSAHSRGFMQPISESNCYFVPRQNLAAIGYADTSFDYEGGGAINLHMFRALGLFPGSSYVLLHGEASFHQFHGGVTSNETREQVVDKFFQQLSDHWRGQYRALTREPLFYGSISPQAQALVTVASRFGERRAKRLGDMGKALWPEQAASALEDLPIFGE
ncbi:glycosyltransferase [Seongchinamella sediminis]|uniref:Glycosyltransferase n=1 Tax=Seongchinamella sediminis TaxID=2283635 RepID=A0A3L7DZ85_9GAMM|nr:glycosyltransferase family A protein [Seongchinamella sediminis]RLQ21162.1 glycosyltransferase [Seongchinamella sediminis]